MRGAAERGHLVIGLGDFNMLPLSLPHRIISTHAPVQDIWRVLHPDSSVGPALNQVEQARRRPIPTSDYNLLENGATCDGVINTWKWNKAQQQRLGRNEPNTEVPGDTIDPKGQRLDYIFATKGAREFEANGGLTVQRAAVGMLERHPVLCCSLSDHFSVQATLMWQRSSSAQENQDTEYHSVGNGAFLQSPTASEHQLSLYNSQRSQAEESLLPIPVYNEIIEIIEKYKGRERKQRWYRMYHFLASVVVSISCLIAVWWSPRNFVAFLLMLLSTLSLCAGIIDGLIGGLFMSSEIRALKEFEWEIRNARAAAGGSDDGEHYEAVKDW
jgi:sphingomyelin phosphodiesterase 2